MRIANVTSTTITCAMSSLHSIDFIHIDKTCLYGQQKMVVCHLYFIVLLNVILLDNPRNCSKNDKL